MKGRTVTEHTHPHTEIQSRHSPQIERDSPEHLEILEALPRELEDWRDENIDQTEGDEDLGSIAESPVKPIVIQLQRIYGKGRRPKLPYRASKWWRQLVRCTRPHPSTLDALEVDDSRERTDKAEKLLDKLDRWAKKEIKRVRKLLRQRGKGRKRGPKGPRIDPKEDRQIWDAWQTRRYKEYADLARELNKKSRDVKLAVDRERQRRKRKGLS
jgi:hypothetical protein